MCEQADIGSHAHSVLFLFFGGVTYGNLDVQSSMSCFNILCEGYCFSLWILTGTRVPHFWGFATPLCCGHQQFCWCKIPPYTIPCSCRFYGLSHMRVQDWLLDLFWWHLAPSYNFSLVALPFPFGTFLARPCLRVYGRQCVPLRTLCTLGCGKLLIWLGLGRPFFCFF